MKQSDKKSSFHTTGGTPYDIPIEGSLGLLTLGYEGIMAWRAKRKEVVHNVSTPVLVEKLKKNK